VLFPTLFAPAFLVTIIGGFDLTIAVYVGIAATFQSGYVPFEPSKCQNAETWGISSNGVSSFFHVAGTLNPSRNSAEKVCQDFVKERRDATGIV
jgi:hypothetical protein